MSICLPELSVDEDWRFIYSDLRGPDRTPLDLTGFALRLQFRPAAMRGLVIATLDEGNGITLSPGANGEGPSIVILSRACQRTWRPLVDTPVTGDLMIVRGTEPDKDQVRLRRIEFVAAWGATVNV